eukprot:10343455-Karenia_brevis.AAC.1
MLPPWFALVSTSASPPQLGIWRQSHEELRSTHHPPSRMPPQANIHHNNKVLKAWWAAEECAAMHPQSFRT